MFEKDGKKIFKGMCCFNCKNYNEAFFNCLHFASFDRGDVCGDFVGKEDIDKFMSVDQDGFLHLIEL